ncbi:UNVERIFIED_CONTAM: hypothetical protein NCL1_54179 [Trichonephila clavipes]
MSRQLCLHRTLPAAVFSPPRDNARTLSPMTWASLLSCRDPLNPLRSNNKIDESPESSNYTQRNTQLDYKTAGQEHKQVDFALGRYESHRLLVYQKHAQSVCECLIYFMAYHDNLRSIPLTGLASDSEEDGEIEKEIDAKDGSMANDANRDRYVIFFLMINLD